MAADVVFRDVVYSDLVEPADGATATVDLSDDLDARHLVWCLRALSGQVRVVVLTGSWPSRPSGGADEAAPADAEAGATGPGDVAVADAVARLRAPDVIAVLAVEGAPPWWVLGVATACDVRITSSRTSFAVTSEEAGRLPPVVAGTLVERLGYPRTVGLYLLGDDLSADEALSAGLLSTVTANPAAAVQAVLTRLGARSRAATIAAKARLSR